MGGAYNTIVKDASALFWNPAGLVNVEQKELLIGGFYAKSDFKEIKGNKYDTEYIRPNIISYLHTTKKYNLGVSFMNPKNDVLYKIGNIYKIYNIRKKYELSVASGFNYNNSISYGINGFISHNTLDSYDIPPDDVGFASGIIWQEIGLDLGMIYKKSSKLSYSILLDIPEILLLVYPVEMSSDVAEYNIDMYTYSSLTAGIKYFFSKRLFVETEFEFKRWNNDIYNFHFGSIMSLFLVKNKIPIQLGYYNISYPYIDDKKFMDFSNVNHFLTAGISLVGNWMTIALSIDSDVIYNYENRDEFNLYLSTVFHFL